MRQPIFPKDTPINEKRIAFIERVIMRLSTRLRKHTIALITPYPISNAVFGEDVKGVVLRYMFPCDGILTKGMIDIGKKLTAGATVELDVFDEKSSELKSYTMSSKRFPLDINLEIKSGDCLEVFINPVDSREKITEAWVSLLWTPSMKDVEVKSFLLNEIEAIVYGELSDIVED